MFAGLTEQMSSVVSSVLNTKKTHGGSVHSKDNSRKGKTARRHRWVRITHVFNSRNLENNNNSNEKRILSKTLFDNVSSNNYHTQCLKKQQSISDCLHDKKKMTAYF